MASMSSTPLLSTSLMSTPGLQNSSAAASSSPSTRQGSSPAEDYVSKYQQVVRSERSAKQSLLWSAVNAALFAVVLYDLTESCSQRPSWVDYIELAFVIVLFINILYHICNYFYILLTFKPMPLTSDQKKLLGVHENDPKFPTMTAEMLATSLSKKKEASSPKTPINTSASSWLNMSLLSQQSNVSPTSSGIVSTSPNLSGIQQANLSLNQSWTNPSPSWNNSLNSSYSTMNNSWMYHTSPGIPATVSPISVEPDEPVVDDVSLNKYLDKLEKMEQKLAAGTSQSPLNSSPTNLSMLWNSQVSAASSELYPMAYHLATNVPAPTLNKTGSPGIESLPGISSISVNDKMWQRDGINQEKLSQWNKNLRQYLTVTVLNPVLREIEDVNQALQRLGFGEEKIGTSTLDKLKRLGQMVQVSQYIPNFATLLPFLEVAQNQEYLVQRIKELAQGGCISDFRWNSGSSFNGKAWDETLPSDAQLIIHFLATYLDFQLPPMRHRSDPRPFSAVYLSKPTDKPKPGENVILIHQVTLTPPHFVLIWKNKVFETPKGRNNLLHVLLLFLHKLKREEGGMMGRINMGPSGLNIMWVLES